MTQVVATLGELCGYDDNVVLAAWRGVDLDVPQIAASVETAGVPRITSIGGTDIGTADELLATLPHASRPTPPPPLFELAAAQTMIPELQLEVTKP